MFNISNQWPCSLVKDPNLNAGDQCWIYTYQSIHTNIKCMAKINDNNILCVWNFLIPEFIKPFKQTYDWHNADCRHRYTSISILHIEPMLTVYESRSQINILYSVSRFSANFELKYRYVLRNTFARRQWVAVRSLCMYFWVTYGNGKTKNIFRLIKIFRCVWDSAIFPHGHIR